MNTQKMIMLLCICSILLPNILLGQTDKERRLSVHLGLQHASLLDEQASPILYQTSGPQLQLGFERRTPNNWWAYQINFGLLAPQAAAPELRFEELEQSMQAAALRISYLKPLVQKEKLTFMLGATFQQEVLLDFWGIADFPWIFGQGGFFVQGRLGYQLADGHQLSAQLGLPLFSWITDMPYNQIPRLEGRAPDVVTVISVGSRIPSWATYQRVDLDLEYDFCLSARWSLNATYQWAWFHDQKPRDFWAYQGSLGIGIIHTW